MSKLMKLKHAETDNITDVVGGFRGIPLLNSSEVPKTFDSSKIVITDKHADYVIFTAKLQTVDIEGANGIIYPRSLMYNTLMIELADEIKNRKFLGEMDHPDIDFENVGKAYFNTRLRMVLYEKLSHVITDIWFQGNEIFGRIETLPTEHGYKMAKLLQRKIPIGFSFRAFGEKVVKNNKIYVDFFYCVTGYDAVTKPSFAGSFSEKTEQLVYTKENIALMECQNYYNQFTKDSRNASAFNISSKSNTTGISKINKNGTLIII